MNFASMQTLESRMLFAAGAIDRSFGTGGGTTIAPPNTAGLDQDILALPDGTIVTAIETSDAVKGGGTKMRVHLRKLTSNGTNDSRFTAANSGGEVVVDPVALATGQNENRVQLAYAGHGRFLLLSGSGFTRFNGNGTIDTSFGDGGRVELHDTGVSTFAVERDGSILFGGVRLHTSFLPTVGHLNPNGSRDESFGTDGVRLVPIDTAAFSDGRVSGSTSHIALTPDGSAYIVANYSAETQSHDPDFPGSVDHEGVIFERLNPDHSLDTGFDGDGVQQSVDDVGGNGEFVDAVHVLPDGSLRLLSAKQLDFAPFMHTIDRTGLSRDRVAPPSDFQTEDGVSAAVGLPDGGFFGVRNNTVNDQTTQRVTRFLPDGREDPAFASAPSDLHVTDLALARDGSLLAMNGEASPTNADLEKFVLRRIWTSNTPVAELNAPSFATGRVGSAVLTVTYRADAAIDRSTLDNRDLRVTGPNGFVAYAKFDRVIKTRLNGTWVQARYKLAAPGGTWDASDLGAYAVRLRVGAVKDATGIAALGRLLGSFNVTASQPA